VPDEDDAYPGGTALTGVLVGFARELRAAGLTVGTGDVLTYFAAMTPLDPTDLVDLYWAGRATLLGRHEDQGGYDRVFRKYFLGEDAPARSQLLITAQSVAEAEAALVMPGTEPGPEEDEERPVLGWMASGVDALKHRSFTACTPDELAALRRIMTRMRLTPPRRRTRRTRTSQAARGTEPDLRATIRASMRMHGEPPGQLFFQQRKTKLRPLILILDVSGSMADYSRHLLQFAHTARHAAARVEVFAFGTRLTRITRELTHERVDVALEGDEVLLEHGDQLAGGLIELALVLPGLLRIEQMRLDAGELGRHRKTEIGVGAEFRVAQGSVERGGEERARHFDRHATADAVFSAGPAGIDEPAIDVMTRHQVAQELAIDRRVQRQERSAETG